MIDDMKTTQLNFIAITIILLINLFFKAGWDLWVRTLTGLFTLLILWAGLWGGVWITTFIKKPPFILLLPCVGISLLFSFTPVISLTVSYDYIVYLILFLTAATFFSNSEYQKKILNLVLFLGGTAAILDFIYPFLFGTTLFPNPHMKIGFFLIVIPVYLDSLSGKSTAGGKSTAKGKILPVVFLILLLFSFSRAHSAWGTFVLIISVVMYLTIIQKIKIHFLWMIVGFLSLLLFFFLSAAEIPLFERLNWLKGGIGMLIERPLTGFGPDSTAHILSNFVEGSRLSLYIHSFFIQFGAECGLIALIALLWLIAAILRNIFTVNKTIFVSLVTVLIYNIFEYNLSIPLIAILFCLLAGSFIKTKKYFYKSNIIFVLAVIPLLFISYKFTRPFVSTRYWTKGMYELKIKDYPAAEKMFNKSLTIFPDYQLPRLGLALLDIYKSDMDSAIKNIYAGTPQIKGGMVINLLTEGEKFLKANKTSQAKMKFLEAIQMRFIQHGFDPVEWL